MKRVFVFSYHGRDTYQTGFNRLLSISERLADDFEVHFVYGNKRKSQHSISIKGNLIEIPLNYSNNFFHSIYKNWLETGQRRLAKTLLMAYFLFTGKEIFDLGREFKKYKTDTNIKLTNEDVVLVSFPSIAIHNLGYSLKQEFGCKLILDYRDPGVFGYKLIEENNIMSFLRRFFLKRNELRNLKNADLVITISESIRNLFPKKYKSSVKVIRNGYDFKKLNSNLICDSRDTFKLVYLGSIYNDQLIDTTFFKGIRKFIDQYGIQPQNFQVKFVGTGESPRLKEVVKHFNLDPYVYVSLRKPVELVYSELYSSSMFFHLKYGDRKEIITTKQYEYLAFQKPILLPVNDQGDLAESIGKYNAGFICGNEYEIVEVLHNAFTQHFNKVPLRIVRTDTELYDLSRQGQEEKLIKLIEAL